jgi:predicted nucleotidyltransferase
MTIERLLAEKREEILRLAASRGARNVRVFGSVARGEAREDSDIDLLVDIESGRSLLDVVGLWLDLELLLGRKVDLLTEGGVNRHLRETILNEARPL